MALPRLSWLLYFTSNQQWASPGWRSQVAGRRREDIMGNAGSAMECCGPCSIDKNAVRECLWPISALLLGARCPCKRKNLQRRQIERCQISAAQHPPGMRAVRRRCFPPFLRASQRAPCCPPNRGACLDLHTSFDAIPCFQARGVRDMEDTPLTGQHDANARKNMSGEVRANVPWPCDCPC